MVSGYTPRYQQSITLPLNSSLFTTITIHNQFATPCTLYKHQPKTHQPPQPGVKKRERNYSPLRNKEWAKLGWSKIARERPYNTKSCSFSIILPRRT